MGQKSAKQSEGVGENGSPTANGAGETQDTEERTKPTLGERRTSFYETVDASEVLPYLIIGNTLHNMFRESKTL